MGAFRCWWIVADLYAWARQIFDVAAEVLGERLAR